MPAALSTPWRFINRQVELNTNLLLSVSALTDLSYMAFIACIERCFVVFLTFKYEWVGK